MVSFHLNIVIKWKGEFGCSHKPAVVYVKMASDTFLKCHRSPLQATYCTSSRIWRVICPWTLSAMRSVWTNLSPCIPLLPVGLRELPAVISLFLIALRTSSNYNGKDTRILNRCHLNMRGSSSVDYQ